MNITLEQAQRLFQEANDFYTGKSPYLVVTSEIRSIAKEVFHQDTVHTMTHVAAEIFRVIAEDSMVRNATNTPN